MGTYRSGATVLALPVSCRVNSGSARQLKKRSCHLLSWDFQRCVNSYVQVKESFNLLQKFRVKISKRPTSAKKMMLLSSIKTLLTGVKKSQPFLKKMTARLQSCVLLRSVELGSVSS